MGSLFVVMLGLQFPWANTLVGNCYRLELDRRQTDVTWYVVVQDSCRKDWNKSMTVVVRW